MEVGAGVDAWAGDDAGAEEGSEMGSGRMDALTMPPADLFATGLPPAFDGPTIAPRADGVREEVILPTPRQRVGSPPSASLRPMQISSQMELPLHPSWKGEMGMLMPGPNKVAVQMTSWRAHDALPPVGGDCLSRPGWSRSRSAYGALCTSHPSQDRSVSQLDPSPTTPAGAVLSAPSTQAASGGACSGRSLQQYVTTSTNRTSPHRSEGDPTHVGGTACNSGAAEGKSWCTARAETPDTKTDVSSGAPSGPAPGFRAHRHPVGAVEHRQTAGARKAAKTQIGQHRVATVKPSFD